MHLWPLDQNKSKYLTLKKKSDGGKISFIHFFSRPSTIPQVIAAIAAAELPVQQWADLIPTLVKNVNGVGNLYNHQIAIQLGGSVSHQSWCLLVSVRIGAFDWSAETSAQHIF